MTEPFTREIVALVEMGNVFSVKVLVGRVILSFLKRDKWEGPVSCWQVSDHRRATITAAQGQKGMANVVLQAVIRAPAKVVVTGEGWEKNFALYDSEGAPVEGLLSYLVLDTTGWINPKPKVNNAWWWERSEYRCDGDHRRMKLVALTDLLHDLVFYLPVGEHEEHPYLHIEYTAVWDSKSE